MWRELFGQQYSDVEFYPPATRAEIELAQTKIGLPMPPELGELYSETNGIYLNDASMWIIWSIDELAKENLYMHTSPEIAFYEMSFKHLFFFGELGNGDLLAMNLDPLSVGIWDHEDGEFRGSASSLQAYFES
jgi:hypothetical protein